MATRAAVEARVKELEALLERAYPFVHRHFETSTARGGVEAYELMDEIATALPGRKLKRNP